MKWLILLGLLMTLVIFIAVRYRRQIQTALQLWKMFRQYKKATAPPPPSAEKKIVNRDAGSALVRCARCGKWLAPSEALNLRSKTSYCSTACMEKAARIESLVDKN
jgi:hypothetical protein